MMAKSIERLVKDAVISRLESLPDVSAVNTSARGKIKAEADLSSGKPSVLITFPGSSKIASCGYYRLIFPVIIDAKFRFDQDVDLIDMESVRDALDEYEQNVYLAMTQDVTWNGFAVDTRCVSQKQKVTTEDLMAPEGLVRLGYRIELHHKSDGPEILA